MNDTVKHTQNGRRAPHRCFGCQYRLPVACRDWRRYCSIQRIYKPNNLNLQWKVTIDDDVLPGAGASDRPWRRRRTSWASELKRKWRRRQWHQTHSNASTGARWGNASFNLPSWGNAYSISVSVCQCQCTSQWIELVTPTFTCTHRDSSYTYGGLFMFLELALHLPSGSNKIIWTPWTHCKNSVFFVVEL